MTCARELSGQQLALPRDAIRLNLTPPAMRSRPMSRHPPRCALAKSRTPTTTAPTQPPAQAPGLGGPQPQRPVANITINANGINDPVKLARLLEPELKRLAVLAR